MPITQERMLLLLTEIEALRAESASLRSALRAAEAAPPELRESIITTALTTIPPPQLERYFTERKHFELTGRRNERTRIAQRVKRQSPKQDAAPEHLP